MYDKPQIPDSKVEGRLQAVLALLRGESATRVAEIFGLCRSALYRLRQRALTAVRAALADQHRGPKVPHNMLSAEKAAEVAELCQRHPTWSSYQLHRHLGFSTPCPRTIQRLRRRQGLPRLPKRAPARSRTKRISRADMQRVLAVLHARPYLGSERLAWELQNEGGVAISAATIKRYRRWLREWLHPPAGPKVWRFYERHHAHSLWHGDCLEKVTLTDLNQTAYQLTLQDDYSRAYVFCDLILEPTVHTAITALIAAIRQWQVIPKAVLFDNGSPFRGRLLESFCRRLGIRLIHTAVRHPQTNGKLERACRDDMKEFYQRQPEWRLDPLRQALPAYVSYRNYLRGHRALGGKPASTRLQHHQRTAAPHMLRRLEGYAHTTRAQRLVKSLFSWKIRQQTRHSSGIGFG